MGVPPGAGGNNTAAMECPVLCPEDTDRVSERTDRGREVQASRGRGGEDTWRVERRKPQSPG